MMETEIARPVKLKPKLFSTLMILSLLAGTKSKTRRIISKWKIQLERDWNITYPSAFSVWNKKSGKQIHKKSGEEPCTLEDVMPIHVGDVLWVKETFVRACEFDENERPIGEMKYYYRADSDWKKIEWQHADKDEPQAAPKWKPSIYMPFKAARIFLKVVDIKIERVQDVTEEEAKAEGVKPDYPLGENDTYKKAFRALWKEINGAESWDDNDYVFVYTFEKINKPEQFL